MAKNLITIEASGLIKVTGKEGKVVRKYRALMMASLSKSIDNIRKNAVNYIIPNSAGTRDPHKAAKNQPAVSGKLTERTGLLIKMLTHKTNPLGGGWSVAQGATTAGRTSKLTTNALKGMIKVSGGFGTISESYLGTLRVYISAGSGIVNDRFAKRYTGWVKDFEGKSRRLPDMTRKQLAIRFQHETGIRGAKRPFIAPSAQNQHFVTTGIFKQKMISIGGVI